MADQAAILALDIGTSSTRAILYDSQGTAVPEVQSQVKYQVTTSQDGEVSVDADELFSLVVRTIDEALKAAGERAQQIVGVATSAFWHTLVPLDKAGHPLFHLLTWEDTRPQQAASELRAQLDEASTHRRTGTRIHACYWPAKIRWLAQAHPEIAERTTRYASFSEYLHERLLGRAICSLSMASGTGLLNTRAQAWDKEMLAHLQLSEEHLPKLGDASDAVQGLVPEFAKRWPALHGVPWFPAIGDGAAANLGSNCANTSTWAVTMGTSSAMRVVVTPEEVTPEQGLWLYYIDRKRALLGGALSEGGNMLAWLQNTLQVPDLDKLDEQLTRLEPASHGLTVLPQIGGERSPGWHAHAAMTVAGINLHTTPEQIARATLEAVVFQLGAIYDQLVHVLGERAQQARLIANGGALLKFSLLSQVLADTLYHPLDLSESSEASSRGAALLALEVLRLIPDLSHLQPETIKTIQPDTHRHEIYTQARERQQALYKLMFGEK